MLNFLLKSGQKRVADELTSGRADKLRSEQVDSRSIFLIIFHTHQLINLSIRVDSRIIFHRVLYSSTR